MSPRLIENTHANPKQTQKYRNTVTHKDTSSYHIIRVPISYKKYTNTHKYTNTDSHICKFSSHIIYFLSKIHTNMLAQTQSHSNKHAQTQKQTHRRKDTKTKRHRHIDTLTHSHTVIKISHRIWYQHEKFRLAMEILYGMILCRAQSLLTDPKTNNNNNK